MIHSRLYRQDYQFKVKVINNIRQHNINFKNKTQQYKHFINKAKYKQDSNLI